MGSKRSQQKQPAVLEVTQGAIAALPLVLSPGPSCCSVPCHCHQATPSSSVSAAVLCPTAAPRCPIPSRRRVVGSFRSLDSSPEGYPSVGTSTVLSNSVLPQGLNFSHAPNILANDYPGNQCSLLLNHWEVIFHL